MEGSDFIKNLAILDAIRGKLVVSCQALETEPLYDPERSLMGRMALAAKLGGAAGIRANTVRDILDIKKFVDLPIIGIIKKEYGDNPVYITPTINEVRALAEINCDIIAIDATCRQRPDNKSLEQMFQECKNEFPDQLFMADCATYDEAMFAAKMGFDVVSTTLCGYTEQTKGHKIPDFDLIKKIVKDSGKFVIAEGGIWTPEQLKQAMDCKADAAVVGTVITRPMDITKRFVSAIS